MRKIIIPGNYAKYSILFALLLIVSLSFFDITTTYCKEDDKKVLYINSYNENFISLLDEKEGMKSVLEPCNIQLDIEYMDTKRFDTEESRSLYYNMLKYKLDNIKPYDAIIVGHDNALQFVMDYQDELFKNIPIVYFGINDVNRAQLASENDYMCGITDQMSIKENIEIGLKFNKKATKVVAIVDNTLTGKGDKKQFYGYEDEFKELSFEDINASEYTRNELEEVLEKIGDNTILLYLSMYKDKAGDNLTILESTDILQEHTHVPVYRAGFGGVGSGLLGGMMISYKEAGKIMANVVLKIFQGTPIQTIDQITENPNKYTFDYNIIKKYNISKDLIPDDAILLNKDISFYEKYRYTILKVLLAMLVLIVIIIILFIDNIKRRIIEKALQDSHEELTQTYEELTASEEELRAQYDTIQVHSYELEILNQKYGIAIESTDSAVWEMNLLDKIISVSKKFRNEINQFLKEQEDINKFLDLLVTVEDKILLKEAFINYIKGDKNEINIQVPIIDQDSNKRWVLIRGQGVKDTKGNINIIHGILLDITKMKNQEEFIEHYARHDYLTNLPNRMSFMNKLKSELERGNSGAIFLLDIDDFKSINDTLGHVYGDKMLQEISDRLTSITDNNIFVSRFGGDEFLVLISNEVNLNNITTYIKNIMKLFENAPLLLDFKEYFIKFSMGITCFPNDSEDINQLIINADTAMYNAKRTGKNNYLFYSTDMQDEIKDKTELEDILRKALKDDGFTLVYQPQVSVITGEIVGFEALLRLKNHMISPAKFITIAEETGLIIEIGRWVTREAIEQIARWKEKGYSLKPIAINFSSKQIRDIGYIEFLEDVLRENKVDAKYIEIEITESILLEKTDKIIEFLNKLKSIGMKIALDDFGTGFSSLNYLTFIPVDKVKLDKSLCEKFLEINDIKVMDSIIALVHSLNLEITAEGIEEVEQYKRLKIGGCDYIQGYLFSKPLKNDDIELIFEYNFLDGLVM